jgi:glycosyltransferase involved in cell wall biosynthesis
LEKSGGGDLENLQTSALCPEPDMKIVYDLRIVQDHMHGMARYALELLQAMLKLGEDLQVGVLLPDAGQQELLPGDERISVWVCGLAPYGPQSQIQIPRLLKQIGPDIYHCPFFGPPVFYNGPMAITLHDLIHMIFPQDYGLKQKLYYRYVVGPAVRKAKAVFTVSQHSKNDLVEMLGVAAGRVHVTYNGVGPEFSPLDQQEQQKARTKLDLPQSYILGVGNNKPHKNLSNLIKAHALLKNGHTQVPELILVGVSSDDLSGMELTPDVRCISHLKDDELPLYYGAAQMVVMPSLYEGFGLPALEGMASGAPVIVSDRASLPEVVGDSGLICAPDFESLARSMAELMQDENLRQKLAQSGPVRAAQFTWEAAARKTLEVYRQILAEGA